jgi:hypothetical protein
MLVYRNPAHFHYHCYHSCVFLFFFLFYLEVIKIEIFHEIPIEFLIFRYLISTNLHKWYIFLKFFSLQYSHIVASFLLYSPRRFHDQSQISLTTIAIRYNK